MKIAEWVRTGLEVHVEEGQAEDPELKNFIDEIRALIDSIDKVLHQLLFENASTMSVTTDNLSDRGFSDTEEEEEGRVLKRVNQM